MTEVTVVLRRAPVYLFAGLGVPPLGSHHLTFRIQPDEGISLAFHAKEPGPGIALKTVRMELPYEESFEGTPAEAYERLLLDAMAGDQTLFTREDGVERAWEVVMPPFERPGPIHPYPAGSWGPEAADELIAPRSWHLH